MKYEISKDKWSRCNICGMSVIDIKKTVGGTNIYFSQAFIDHLVKEHNIEPSDYFEKIDNRPECSCGICGGKTDVSWRGSKIYWKEFKCGRNDGVKIWSKKARYSRRGEGNPMFGKEAWNKGIRATDDERVRRMTEAMRSGFVSPETRKKMSVSALRRLSRGDILKTKTVPHMIMCDILDRLNIRYKIEHVIGKYSFDIFIPVVNLVIEVDGDYWHCNPSCYPDGPINVVQRVNVARDKAKNKYCTDSKIEIVRFWEKDIKENKQFVMESVLCIVKKLSQ